MTWGVSVFGADETEPVATTEACQNIFDESRLTQLQSLAQTLDVELSRLTNSVQHLKPGVFSPDEIHAIRAREGLEDFKTDHDVGSYYRNKMALLRTTIEIEILKSQGADYKRPTCCRGHCENCLWNFGLARLNDIPLGLSLVANPDVSLPPTLALYSLQDQAALLLRPKTKAIDREEKPASPK